MILRTYCTVLPPCASRSRPERFSAGMDQWYRSPGSAARTCAGQIFRARRAVPMHPSRNVVTRESRPASDRGGTGIYPLNCDGYAWRFGVFGGFGFCVVPAVVVEVGTGFARSITAANIPPCGSRGVEAGAGVVGVGTAEVALVVDLGSTFNAADKKDISSRSNHIAHTENKPQRARPPPAFLSDV